jgi:hypothetical protein
MTTATVTIGRRARTSAVRPLARVETLRVLRHPAFLVGALGAAVLVGRSFAVQTTGAWVGEDYFVAFSGWFPLWLGTMIAAALVAGRGRLLQDPDLFSGVPAPPETRVVATMLALGAPLLVTVAGVAAAAAAVDADGGFHLGRLRYSEAVVPPFAEWAQIPLIVLLAGVVGVAIAQLPRWRLGALVVVGSATFLSSIALWAFDATPLRTFYPFMFRAHEQPLPADYRPADWAPGDPAVRFPDEYTARFREIRLDDAAAALHLVYLSGLVLAVAWLAVRLAGGGRRWHWLAAGIPMAVVAGVAQYLAAGPAT